jgi:hypothetical protein
MGKRLAGTGIASFGKDGTAMAVPTSMPVGLERSPLHLNVEQLGLHVG